MRGCLIAVTLLCLTVPAMAQQPAPSAAPAAPAAAAPAAAAAPTGRQASPCQVKGRQQGLRGPALRDFAQVCVLEARLTCLKDAIAKKIDGAARKEYMRTCGG